MHEHGVEHMPEIRRVSRLASFEDVGKVAEKPRAAQAPPANNHTVALGLAHQAKSIGGLPDIAVPKNWNTHSGFEFADSLPLRYAAI